jgi:protocatechuate 3,4-dioxygenase, beta subunit
MTDITIAHLRGASWPTDRTIVRLLARRHTLAALGSLPAAIATPAAAQSVTTGARPTPRQTLGPFYPRNESEQPRETDADLLVVDGDRVRSRGEPLYLTGRVRDRSGQPVADALVEIWQCDANAVYHHPAGGAPAERDPHFQGYGRMQTGTDGSFHFRTIRPVAYPGRTPHIHVRIAPRAGAPLATQLYLADDPGNARDFSVPPVVARRTHATESRAAAVRWRAKRQSSAGARHPLDCPHRNRPCLTAGSRQRRACWYSGITRCA